MKKHYRLLGSILFNESSFDDLDKKEKRNLRKEIGMLFQGGALFDYLTWC